MTGVIPRCVRRLAGWRFNSGDADPSPFLKITLTELRLLILSRTK